MKKEYEIKSLLCYGVENVKKAIWSLKTDKDFYKSEAGVKIAKILENEITKESGLTEKVVVCVPSSSFWQNKKKFDHMHILLKNIAKDNKQVFNYISYAIIPRLHKDLQKGLNKKQRQDQTISSFELSGYFKKVLKNKFLEIIIIDDVKTTGATLNECAETIQRYLVKEKIDEQIDEKMKIRCLTIAYEA